MVTCAIIALVVIASIFLGAHAALYGVLGGLAAGVGRLLYGKADVI